jgi:peroxiredoxin
MTVLGPGTPAPAFSLRRSDSSRLTNEDIIGRTTVLAFYPAAFSDVCSDQFSIYQEVLGDLAAEGATLYGVSCDQTESQDAFRRHLGLDIEMLSDYEPKGAASRAFGVYWEPTGVSNRALVVIDADGIVRWTWEGEHPGTVPGANLIFDGLHHAHA